MPLRQKNDELADVSSPYFAVIAFHVMGRIRNFWHGSKMGTSLRKVLEGHKGTPLRGI